MHLDADDLRSLTRDDVNSEFSHLKFGDRKKLWLFFEKQKEAIGRNGTVSYCFMNIRNKRDGEIRIKQA